MTKGNATETSLFDEISAAWSPSSKGAQAAQGEVIDPKRVAPPSIPEDLARLAIHGASVQAATAAYQKGVMDQAAAHEAAAKEKENSFKSQAVAFLTEPFQDIFTNIDEDHIPNFMKADREDVVDRGAKKGKEVLNALAQTALSMVTTALSGNKEGGGK